MVEAEPQKPDLTIIYDGGLHSTPYSYNVDPARLRSLYDDVGFEDPQIERIRLILAKNEQDIEGFGDPSRDVGVFTDSIYHPSELTHDEYGSVGYNLPEDLAQKRLNKVMALDVARLKSVNDPDVARKIKRFHLKDRVIKLVSIPAIGIPFYLSSKFESLQDVVVAAGIAIATGIASSKVYQKLVVERFFYGIERRAVEFAQAFSRSNEPVITIERRK